ncbi:hypothetical protein N2W54_007229 [Lotmaria passim]
MWGGIDFFVSLETLMSASVPPDFPSEAAAFSSGKSRNETEPLRLPGNPTVRCFEFSAERRRTPLFVYPNATLFLQVLCSSGNRVHLLTPWSKEDTTAILKGSEWVGFLKDARRVACVPGSSVYSFASLGIEPDAYVRTVLVVDDATRWSGATTLQLIEVQHTREGVAAFHSMELLFALSRCILFSEWLLRYPGSSIASCVALCNTTLFSFCRFFFLGEVVDAGLMLLVSFHGGRVVKTEAEATHVVVLPAPAPEPTSSSSSSTASSGSAASSSSSDGSESSSEDEEGEEGESAVDSSSSSSSERAEEKWEKRPRSAAAVSSSTSAAAAAAAAGLHEDPTAPPPPSSGPSVKSAAPSPSSRLPPSGTATTESSTVAALFPSMLVVTPEWIYRSVRALRIVPLDVDDATGDVDAALGANEEADVLSTTEEAEKRRAARAAHAAAARKSRLLLCCLLPPPDARPLIWTTFLSIARQNHYDTLCFSAAVNHGPSNSSSSGGGNEGPQPPTAAAVLESLTSPSLKDVVEVRLLSSVLAAKPASGGGGGGGAASAASSARARGAVVTRAALGTLKLSAASTELSRIALSRFERRRDKDAVFSHLQLVESQFLYSYEFVQRRRMQELHREAGTQTSGPRHASVGVMTDAATADTAAVEEKRKTPSPSSTAVTTGSAEVAGSVDAEEWRHHLKNVEGKLLSRHDAPPADGEIKQEDHYEEEAKTTNVNQKSSEKLDTMAGKGDQSNSDGAPQRDEAAASATTSVNTSVTAQSSSLFSQPPPWPQGGNSIFQAAPLFPPPMESGSSSLLYSARPFNAVPLSSETRYTACFIPTSALTQEQQDDFFVELRSYPIFSSLELGNNVVRLADGVKCEFASHKAAEDFHRIDFIEFLSLHLPIYPYFEDPVEAPLPQPHHHHHHQQEQAHSLWTTPETVPEEAARHDKAGSTSTPCASSPRSPQGSSLSNASNTFGGVTWEVREHASTVVTVPPYRSLTNAAGAVIAPSRKHGRDEASSTARRSGERFRRLGAPNSADAAGRSPWTEGRAEPDARPRRHHRDDSSDAESRRRGERSRSGSNHRRDGRREERARYSTERLSSSHRSHRNHRESRRHRSPTDDGDL